MSSRESTLKEKFRIALTSTAKVISDDFDLNKKISDKNKSKDTLPIEINSINSPSDFIKYQPFGLKTLAIRSPKSYKELMSYEGFNPKKVSSLMTGLKVEYVFKKIVKFYKEL